MSVSTGQAILAIVESDIATVAGAPLIQLFTALQNAKGNMLAQQAAILAFVAQAPALGIQLEIDIEGQLLNAAISKIQGFIAAKTAAPAA